MVRILRQTRENFGRQQFDTYKQTLAAALAALEDGPSVLGSLALDRIRAGMRSLHVARLGRRGRHVLVYIVRSGSIIEVVRVLHDAMDMERHIPPTEN